MKNMLAFAKTTLVGGLLVVLPAWVAALLLLKAIGQLNVLVTPVSSQLPKEINHPDVVATVALIALCFVVGLLVRTAVGRRAERAVERNLLERLPGYSTLRNVALQMGEARESHGFRPALAEIEDALAPCFIVEEYADGRFTIFVPSAPTPAAGTIYIIDAARVHPVNVSVTTMFKCITKWGGGCGNLLAAMEKGA